MSRLWLGESGPLPWAGELGMRPLQAHCHHSWN